MVSARHQKYFIGYSFDAKQEAIGRRHSIAWEETNGYAGNHPTITGSSFRTRAVSVQSKDSYASVVSNESDIFTKESAVESIVLPSRHNRRGSNERDSWTIHPSYLTAESGGQNARRSNGSAEDQASQEYCNDIFVSCPGNSTLETPGRTRHSISAFSPSYLPGSFNSDDSTIHREIKPRNRRFSSPDHSPTRSFAERRPSDTWKPNQRQNHCGTYIEFLRTRSGTVSKQKDHTGNGETVENLQDQNYNSKSWYPRRLKHPGTDNRFLVNMIPGSTSTMNCSANDMSNPVDSEAPFEASLQQARRSYFLRHKKSGGRSKTISFRDDTSDPLPEQQYAQWVRT